MSVDEQGGGLELQAWLDRLESQLVPRAAMSETERDLVLDLARVTAHRSLRKAAPITTYLAGIALAGLTPAQRATRLSELVAALDTD